ncbi:C1 family peptidase [Streptomyces sp. NPDC020472]|uniref:C1 family peptidase n=1 Tax=Streptomyces sp. NPDC020472 TaxID=3365075 RepID=UPI0037A6B889
MVDKKAPENAGFNIRPAQDVKLEDVATLTLTAQNGMTVLKATDGTAIPAHLAVMDDAGEVVAVYQISTEAPTAQPGISGTSRQLNHAVLLAGYGTQNGTPYFLIK